MTANAYKSSNEYDDSKGLKHFSGAVPVSLFGAWKAELARRGIKIRTRITTLIERDAARLRRETDRTRRVAE
jgi:hypothetical protein